MTRDRRESGGARERQREREAEGGRERERALQIAGISS